MRWIIVLALLASCKDKPEVDAGPATVAAKDTSPAKAPPALRSPHPPVPSLPDLPALAKHEPAAPLPGNVRLAVGGKCGGVWNGEDVAPRS